MGGAPPVVTPTCSSDEREVVESSTGGANSYLQKPVNLLALHETGNALAEYRLDLSVFLMDIG